MGSHKPKDPSVMFIIHASKTGLPLSQFSTFVLAVKHNKTWVLLRESNLGCTYLRHLLDMFVTAVPAVQLLFRAVSPTNVPPATAPSWF